MAFAVMIDFGSTYTKVVCVDLKGQKMVLSDRFPSTVKDDAVINLNQCYDAVKQEIGENNFQTARRYAASSAAGGLRMAVSGLTETLSTEAGKCASFRSGAKVVYSQFGKIKPKDLEAIKNADAEILLLCGGYEKGNTKGIWENVMRIADSDLRIPVIYAGNSSIAKEVRSLFTQKGKECYLSENIIPDVKCLNTEYTADIVRSLFMKRIVDMKGVGQVQQHLDAPIVPVPSAVLSAGELLSKGTDITPGLGEIVMVDIGGATTDIYSYLQNTPHTGARIIGTEEPFSKRTVEGDIGMRESSVTLIKAMGEEAFVKECRLPQDVVQEAINKRITERSYVADNAQEKEIDFQLARGAVKVASRRHAGCLFKEYSNGAHLIQRGKNLENIKHVIGTGGILVNEERAASALCEVCADAETEKEMLLPSSVSPMIDKDYVVFAAGLLSETDPEAALSVMMHSLNI